MMADEPLTWRNETRRLGELVPWENNARQMREDEAGRLVDSLERFGQVQTIAIEPDNTICDGHQRRAVWGACAEFGPDFVVDVRVASRKLTERERQQLSVYLHRGAVGEFDFDGLAGWEGVDVPDLVEWGFSESELLGGGIWEEAETEDSEDDLPRAFYVPDAIFPSDNEWGIPTLDIALQADFLELPLTKWGDASRKNKMRGTYHFYTEDYKYEALWKDPLDLVNSQCVAIIEPNFSTNEQMPMAVGLWNIYRKRWLARYAQSYGVKVWVDLNVAQKFAALNLLGVPEGWRAFAARALSGEVEMVEADYQTAAAQCSELLFLVYGGGGDVEALCKERGWLWLPENMHVKDGRREADYG